jgi:fatty acid desaturase
MSTATPLPPAAFFDAVDALGRAQRDVDPAGDLAHLRRVAAAGRALTALGVLAAAFGPNPIAVVALSLGRFARWTMVGHHVAHRGYDRVGGPAGRAFGEGWRRAVDWFDWLVPAAWKHEHNQLHHYRLNEARDPDLVEENLSWLRAAPWPVALKRAVVVFFALTWRWVYYAPNTLAELHRAADAREGLPRNAWTWDPRRPAGRDLWLKSLLPYGLVHFVVFPAVFLPFGVEAALAALANSVLAELLVNAHAFLVIVPNHAGPDLLRFDTPARGKAAFAWRQIRGSANFRTGGAVNDFLHGYLNYQIEHHLWPDLPMRAYARAAPELRALCAAHGVPYVQESVWRRLGHTVRIMTGESSMGREAAAEASPEACVGAAAR